MNLMAEIIVANTVDGLVWSSQTYSQTCIHKHKSTNTYKHTYTHIYTRLMGLVALMVDAGV